LRKGEIVERGSHDVLLSDVNGIYYDMWQKQLESQNGDALTDGSTGSEDGGARKRKGSQKDKEKMLIC
jgi:hypothetical protein